MYIYYLSDFCNWWLAWLAIIPNSMSSINWFPGGLCVILLSKVVNGLTRNYSLNLTLITLQLLSYPPTPPPTAFSISMSAFLSTPSPAYCDPLSHCACT